MKQLALIALLVFPLLAGSNTDSVDQTSEVVDFTYTIAATQSDMASVFSTVTPDLEDHYGNPAHFIQYIIRIPPVHA